MTIKYTKEFVHTRITALKRDDYTCQICGKKVAKPDVHHKIPLRLDGTNEESNLITLCRPCHGKEEAKLRPKRKKGKMLLVEIPNELKNKLKLKAISQGTTLKALVIEGIEEILVDKEILV